MLTLLYKVKALMRSCTIRAAATPLTAPVAHSSGCSRVAALA
jgi:hypothetical protein